MAGSTQATSVSCDGPVNIRNSDASIVERKPHSYWWPIYKEIKLRKKEELRPLNTGGAKLSEVRWLKATCVAVKRARAVTFANVHPLHTM
jgi:hypothetical protein